MRRLILSAVMALLPAVAQADRITVFAAASLKDALDAIAADWQAETGHEVAISYAGSAQLAQQIAAGAPADLFVSASEDWMDDLSAKGLVIPGSRVDLLGNTLVLVASGRQAALVDLATLDIAARVGQGKLAMALVDSVPAGVYGKQALTKLGLWEQAEPFVAQADNVRAALALVAAGEATLGIVYGSDAIAAAAAGEAVTQVAQFPPDSHDPILYPMALISTSVPAAEFAAALQGADAQREFAAQGFVVLR